MINNYMSLITESSKYLSSGPSQFKTAMVQAVEILEKSSSDPDIKKALNDLKNGRLPDQHWMGQLKEPKRDAILKALHGLSDRDFIAYAKDSQPQQKHLKRNFGKF